MALDAPFDEKKQQQGTASGASTHLAIFEEKKTNELV
jgi:hypothetical protein